MLLRNSTRDMLPAICYQYISCPVCYAGKQRYEMCVDLIYVAQMSQPENVTIFVFKTVFNEPHNPLRINDAYFIYPENKTMTFVRFERRTTPNTAKCVQISIQISAKRALLRKLCTLYRIHVCSKTCQHVTGEYVVLYQLNIYRMAVCDTGLA